MALVTSHASLRLSVWHVDSFENNPLTIRGRQIQLFNGFVKPCAVYSYSESFQDIKKFSYLYTDRYVLIMKWYKLILGIW